jgi:hypothetical protein
MAMDSARAPGRDAPADHQQPPTNELVTRAAGDRCASCNAPLAPDQRYCVNCGERRGKARFSAEALTAQTVAGPAEATARPPRSRFSSGTTLIAGIATLLIAMGVGVLIGHSSNSTPVRASAPAVLNLGAGAGTTPAAAAAATGAASNGPASTGTKAHRKRAKAKVVRVVMTAKVQKAADAAAAKVLGSNNNLSKNVQQQIGGACSGGAGCQNGKFTGNFFPGG